MRGWLLCLVVCHVGIKNPQAMQVDSGQAAAPLQYQQGRTGLGLYFCALVADLHRNKGVHGQIICDNRGLDGGGRFCLRLP